MKLRRLIALPILFCLASSVSACSGPDGGGSPHALPDGSIAYRLGSQKLANDSHLSRNTWTERASDPIGSTDLSVGVSGHILYAVGGGGNAPCCQPTSWLNTLEAYNPTTNSWRVLAPMPTPRCCAAMAVDRDVLYVVGGQGNQNIVGTVEAYNSWTNKWTTKAPMPTPRYALGVGFVHGILYAVGGVQPGPVTPALGTTVEAYDPKANSWMTKAPLPVGRTNLQVAVVHEVLYVFGGVGGPNGTAGENTVEAYEPRTDTWTAKAQMPYSISNGAAAVVDGKIYVAGGCTVSSSTPAQQSCYSDMVESYDPKLDKWSTLKPMLIGVDGPAGGSVDGIFYVVGGQNARFMNIGTVQAFRP